MRNFAFPNYSNAQFLSIAGAVLLHIILTAFAFLPSKPMVIREQFIQVNLARPSQHASYQQKSIKLENNFIIAKAFGTAKSQNNPNKLSDNKLATAQKDKESDNNKKDIQNSFLTSGEVARDAIADNGAYTKPVFDAPSLQNGAPTYPEYARRNGIQGKVILEVQVTREGEAKEVAIVSSSGYDTLDKAAFEAVKNWHFIPARLNGKVVDTPMPILIPIIFSFS